MLPVKESHYMPVQFLPCPFCGGQVRETREDGLLYWCCEHSSWQCPMAAASGEVFQLLEAMNVTEWNERAEIKETGNTSNNTGSTQAGHS
jgi:hypothetical protein